MSAADINTVVRYTHLMHVAFGNEIVCAHHRLTNSGILLQRIYITCFELGSDKLIILISVSVNNIIYNLVIKFKFINICNCSFSCVNIIFLLLLLKLNITNFDGILCPLSLTTSLV